MSAVSEWLAAAVLVIALFLVLWSFFDALIGGGVLAIVLTLASLIRPVNQAVIKMLSGEGAIRWMAISIYLSAVSWMALLAALAWFWFSGALTPAGIEAVVKNPLIVMIFGAASALIAGNAARDATMGLQARGAMLQIVIMALPAYAVMSLFNFEQHPWAVYVALTAAVLFTTLSLSYGSFVVQRNKIREQRLELRDARARTALAPLEAWGAITAFMPRFVAIRREISYLQGLRAEARGLLDRRQAEQSEQKYEVFEFEHARINLRVQSEIEQNLRAEMVEQLALQKARANAIRERVGGGPLAELVSSVEAEIDQFAAEYTGKNDWRADETLQRKFGELERFLRRLDRLEALSESGDDKNLERHFRGLIGAQECSLVATELGWPAEQIASASTALREVLNKIVRREVDSAKQLLDLGLEADEAYGRLNDLVSKFRERMARVYDVLEVDAGAYVLCPRAVQSKEEAMLLLVRRADDTQLSDAKVQFVAAGVEFGRSAFDLAAMREKVELVVARFVAKAVKRTTLEAVVTNGAEVRTAKAKIEVNPTLMEMIQESSAVSGIVGIVVGVALWLLEQDTAIASTVGAVAAVLFLATRVLLRRGSIQQPSEPQAAAMQSA